jgi:hypothetical protein
LAVGRWLLARRQPSIVSSQHRSEFVAQRLGVGDARR